MLHGQHRRGPPRRHLHTKLAGFVAAVSDAHQLRSLALVANAHLLRLLALVADAHPRDAIAPLVAAALRRVREPDSSVRAALVDAARAAAGAAASAPVGSLADALLHEEAASQIGPPLPAPARAAAAPSCSGCHRPSTPSRR
ncbi:hypothetical protein ACP70R_043338 [Stipagrostis hirtigluma subsp. patula]